MSRTREESQLEREECSEIITVDDGTRIVTYSTSILGEKWVGIR
jgi:hypothetical protein